jgi:hypothetical protein
MFDCECSTITNNTYKQEANNNANSTITQNINEKMPPAFMNEVIAMFENLSPYNQAKVLIYVTDLYVTELNKDKEQRKKSPNLTSEEK